VKLGPVEEAERRGELRAGITVIENTGGSTGSSLAFVCAAKGFAIAEELGAGHTVVTVAVDTGLKYLDGDLFVGRDSQI
jgi:cysteine synthase